jgi:predicted RNase H-like nuclease (RuvC/YqgF family)
VAESPEGDRPPPEGGRSELESLRLTVRSLIERNRRLETEAGLRLRRHEAESSERIAELERQIERLELSVEELGGALELERARLARIGKFLPIERVRRLRARVAGEPTPGTDGDGADGSR